LVGFVGQEFAALPRDDFPGFQAFMKDRLLSVDSSTYPILAANVPMLANHAFILRWQNGAEAPLEDSFDFYIDLVIGGLDFVLRRSRT
jgi:TetR/AcrR family transcriptional regulator, tetracycline repressor protein